MQEVFPHKSLFLVSGFFPTLVAHGDVCIISAEQNLTAGGDDVSTSVDTGIDGCFVTAGADGFDLGNGVGNLEEATATGEEMRQKVGAESEAHDGKVIDVNDFAQLVDLLRCEELTFIGDDNVTVTVMITSQSR